MSPVISVQRAQEDMQKVKQVDEEIFVPHAVGVDLIVNGCFESPNRWNKQIDYYKVISKTMNRPLTTY